MEQRPFGTWRSPIAASSVAAQSVRLSAVAIDSGGLFWIEGRPHEGGRNVLVCRRPNGSTFDVLPTPFNVRSRVHEYGGGAYIVSNGEIWFSNFSDQRVYRLAVSAAGPGSPEPVTAVGQWCFADFTADPVRRRVVAVREDHSRPGEPVTTLVGIAADAESGSGRVIAEGYDFYSTPRFNHDGSRLCWLAWRHPNMPWDGTELWTAEVDVDGRLARQELVAGGDEESIYQPGWGPDGSLYFASDRNGWWHLYRSGRSDRWRSDVEPVLSEPPPDAEFGRPQWVFGTATWALVGPSRLVAAYTQRGSWFLADVDTRTGSWRRIETDLEPQEWVTAEPAAARAEAVLIAASPTQSASVVRLDLDSGEVEVVRAPESRALDAAAVSRPVTIECPTGDEETAHAFYYPPASASSSGRPDERPPLMAISHGGPTTATTATFDLRIQYWTSRGFAVVDVNYRGSSGFGRAYRNRLRGAWGVADVDDMVHVARDLAARGLADPARLVIRGGSAGGYTTLAALTFRPGTFTAGASYYGVSDLEALARDTHKFEARYLDRLVGPYPAARSVYRDRSPVHHVDRLACPIILFQGLEDKVVPPNQSEMMADTARRNGLAVAYVAFEGEQHGFRKAETIVRCLEAELYFYGAVFGFTPADVLAPVPIDNL